MSILFVDDDPSFLDGLRHVLHRQRREWEMTFVRSAAEALEQATAHPFDTVVTDLRMERMGGLELVRRLRASEATRSVPVIVLTGAHESDLKRRALDIGATDLLNKPVRLEDLLARLRSVLRLKAQQDELRELNLHLEEKVRQRTAQLEEARAQVVSRLAKAGEYRDEETGDHIARVACYCRLLGERMGLGGSFIESIYLMAPLHDIGKLGIPDEVLLKPGPLDDRERAIMQRHCEIGASILREKPRGMDRFLRWRQGGGTAGVAAPAAAEIRGDGGGLAMAAAIALYHHERWDGRGYPHGLAAEEIPPAARITSVADVYDALRSERPYKPAYDHEQTMEIMRAGADDGQFDPAVFVAFEFCQGEFLEVWQDSEGAEPAAVTPGEGRAP